MVYRRNIRITKVYFLINCNVHVLIYNKHNWWPRQLSLFDIQINTTVHSKRIADLIIRKACCWRLIRLNQIKDIARPTLHVPMFSLQAQDTWQLENFTRFPSWKTVMYVHVHVHVLFSAVRVELKCTHYSILCFVLLTFILPPRTQKHFLHNNNNNNKNPCKICELCVKKTVMSYMSYIQLQNVRKHWEMLLYMYM